VPHLRYPTWYAGMRERVEARAALE
jgi:hypothetical protein